MSDSPLLIYLIAVGVGILIGVILTRYIYYRKTKKLKKEFRDLSKEFNFLSDQYFVMLKTGKNGNLIAVDGETKRLLERQQQ